jgi:phage/plasmid-associated DNA primase
MERGLDEPDRVIKATEEYRAEENHLLAFLEEVCEIDRALPDKEAADANEVRTLYMAWCTRAGQDGMTPKELTRSLKMMDIPIVRVGKSKRYRWLKI